MKLKWKFSIISPVLVVGAIWCIAMLTLLIVMATFNQPIADQYNYMDNFHQKSLLGNVLFDYTHWSGRLVQTLSLGLSYKLFGDYGAQIFAPIVLLFLLGASFTWVIYQLFKFKKHHFTFSLLLGFLLSGGVLYTLTCLFDVYLWLDAAFVYFLGLVSVVYNVGLLIWALQNFPKLKKQTRSRLIFIPLLLIAILLQTASEGSMVFSVGWSFLILLATCIYRPWRQYRLPVLMVFLALLIGALVMVLSPGLWGRASIAKEAVPFFELVFLRPLVGVERFLSSLHFWQVALTLLIGTIVGLLAPIKVRSRELKQGIIASLLLLISGFYVPLVVYFLGSHAQYVETRVLSLPCMTSFLAVVLCVATLVAFFSQKYRSRLFTSSVSIAALVVLSTITIFGFFSFNQTYLAVLSARNNLVTERNARVYEYQVGATSQLTVPSAPTMLIDSGATDFTLNGFSTLQWFFDSFAKYYHLDPSIITVSGEPLMTGSSGDEWYHGTGRNACVPRNDLIFDIYSCEYIPETTYGKD